MKSLRRPGADVTEQQKNVKSVLGHLATGTKHDTEKPRHSLMPPGFVGAVLRVLEHGARKYSPGNWARVPEARTRYYDALQRHVDAWWQGERIDPESGEPHLAHAACCVAFLLWFDENKSP